MKQTKISELIHKMKCYLIWSFFGFVIVFIGTSLFFFIRFDNEVLDKSTDSFFLSQIEKMERNQERTMHIVTKLQNDKWFEHIILGENAGKPDFFSPFRGKECEEKVLFYDQEGRLLYPYRSTNASWIEEKTGFTIFEGKTLYENIVKIQDKGFLRIISCPVPPWKEANAPEYAAFALQEEKIYCIQDPFHFSEEYVKEQMERFEESGFYEDQRYHYHMEIQEDGTKLLFFQKNSHNSLIFEYTLELVLIVFLGILVLWVLIRKLFRPITEGVVMTEEELESALNLRTEQLNKVLDGIDDPISIKTLEGEYVFVNESLADCFGVEKEALVGQKDRALTQEDARTTNQIVENEVLYTKETVSYLSWEETKNKGRRLFSVKKNLYCDVQGIPIGFITISRDITDDKKREENLENEIMKNAYQLAVAEKFIMEREKSMALSELINGFIHDLNNQIGVTATVSSFMGDKVNSMVEKYHEKELKRSDFDHLIHVFEESLLMIQSNLELAKDNIQHFRELNEDQTTNKLKRIELVGYIEQILDNWRPRLKKKGIHLEIKGEEEIQMEIRAGYISSVLNNLLDNSVKHGFEEREKGNIGICVKEEEGQVWIRYWDDGKGIPNEIRNRVFEPYFTTNQESGTGLGLPIIKDLVEKKLSGTLELKPQESGGVCFEIRIPLYMES